MNHASRLFELLKTLVSKKLLVVSKNYSNIVSKKHFTAIKKKNASDLPVYAVDGGCSIIADGGSWIYAKIKISVIGYQGYKMIKKRIDNFYYGAVNTGRGRRDVLFEKNKQVDLNVKSMHKNGDIDEMPAKVMKLLEWNACLELLKKSDSGMVLMDSGFNPDNKDEEKIIGMVKSLSLKKNIPVIGFCKTTRMATNTGRSFIGVLSKMSSGLKKPWFYYPVFENEKNYSTGIVKMNFLGKYSYKINFWGNNVLSALNELTFYCNDKELLGYPYPLLKADKLGRVSDFETKSEFRRFKIQNAGNELLEDLKSQSFHSELDRRRYK